MISLVLTERSKPSIQFFVTFTVMSSTEITIGKLSTVISIWLLLAFEAMPDKSVSDAAKPIDARVMIRQNNPKSAIGFFRSSANNRKPVKERITVNKKL